MQSVVVAPRMYDFWNGRDIDESSEKLIQSDVFEGDVRVAHAKVFGAEV